MAIGDKLVSLDDLKTLKQYSDAQDGNLKSAFDDVTEETKNLWLWGDKTLTGGEYVINNNGQTIPSGTYTLSAQITRASQERCRMQFYKNSVISENRLASVYVDSGSSRNNATFTLNDTATIILIASGETGSSEVEASWHDIQIEDGNEATKYVPPMSAVDFVARNDIEDLDGEIVGLENGWNETQEAIGVYYNYSPVTVPTGSGYGDGKFWNKEQAIATLGSSSNYYAYSPFPVVPGEVFNITIYRGSSSKQAPILVVKEDYTILNVYRDDTSTTNVFDVQIPENGAYLLLTTLKANTSTTLVKKGTSILRKTLTGISGGTMDFTGKKVAIIGDSISTNGDWNASTNPLGNVPEIVIEDADVGVTLSAYATYYDIGTTVGGHEIIASDVGTELTFTPVAGDVGKIVGKPLSYNAASAVVWWEVAMEELGFTPIPVCWSGASLSSHEENDHPSGNYIYKCSYAWHPSQIRKCGIRTPGTMTRTAPDVIIIYRGTNDFSHEPFTKLDTSIIDTYPGTYPESDYDGTYYGYIEAIQLTVKKLREAYPFAKIVLCTLNTFRRDTLPNYSTYPVNNGINTLPQYNSAIRKVAESLDCGLIDFANDGITFENCVPEYISETHMTHPNNKGHKVMGKRAMLDLVKCVNSMG